VIICGIVADSGESQIHSTTPSATIVQSVGSLGSPGISSTAFVLSTATYLQMLCSSELWTGFTSLSTLPNAFRSAWHLFTKAAATSRCSMCPKNDLQQRNTAPAWLLLTTGLDKVTRNTSRQNCREHPQSTQVWPQHCFARPECLKYSLMSRRLGLLIRGRKGYLAQPVPDNRRSRGLLFGPTVVDPRMTSRPVSRGTRRITVHTLAIFSAVTLCTLLQRSTIATLKSHVITRSLCPL